MQHVRFIADFDYTWPSRAVTAFKAGYEGPVKRCVSRAAIAAGKAELVLRDNTAPQE